MVYTDNIHLIADSLEELHKFADKIGLKNEWFQSHKRHPHYDLMGSKIKLAIKSGAIVMSSKELVEIINKNKKK